MSKTVIEQATNPDRKYTQKQLALLNEFHRNGLDAHKAAEVAGYTVTSKYDAIRSLKNELIEIAEMELVQSAPLAAKTMTGLMTSDKPIPQASVKLSASQTILDRVGLGKKEKMEVDHKVSGGIFVIPAKQPIDIDPINE